MEHHFVIDFFKMEKLLRGHPLDIQVFTFSPHYCVDGRSKVVKAADHTESNIMQNRQIVPVVPSALTVRSWMIKVQR